MSTMRGPPPPRHRHVANRPHPGYGTTMPSITSVPNIGPRQRRRRRLVGVVTLLIGAGFLAAFTALGAPRFARIVLFVPFWIGVLGLLQDRKKT